MDYYKTVYERYKKANKKIQRAGLEYWIARHAENINAGREDLIIFSSKMIATIILAQNKNTK